MRCVLSVAAAMLLMLTVGVRAEEPTTGPSELAINDAEAIKASLGKVVSVTAKVKSATWSASGKVMNIEVEGAADTKFMFAAFVKSREGLDKAFSGDFGKAITGATIKVSGKLAEFKSRTATRPQIIIDNSSYVQIVEPAKAAE